MGLDDRSSSRNCSSRSFKPSFTCKTSNSMPSVDLKPKAHEIDHRKAILSLRWLLIILASYLTLFSYIGTEQFSLVFGTAIAFSLSNLALTFIPKRQFLQRKVQQGIAFLD